MGEVRALLADRAMRLLVTGSLINSVGNGVFAACGIIYLTKFVGFSAGQLGVGLTVAEVIGFAAGLPIGAICDRYGPKRTTLGLLAVQAIALTVFVFADAFCCSWPRPR